MNEKKEKKTQKRKIDKFLASGSYDIFTTEDYYSEKSPSSKKKSVEKEDRKNSGQFIGKIQQLFSNADTKEFLRMQQATEVENQNLSNSQKYQTKDYDYIQMKLRIDRLSTEFKKELEEYRLSGIKIRKATEDDLEIFVKLYNRAFMKGLDPWSPATEEQFRQILKHENTVVLIASSHGEDVGFIITDLEGESNEIGVICGLGVDPRWQRQGIARYLGIASWDYFRNRDVKELRCEVYEHNIPSYELIKNLHFKEYGKKTYQF